MLEEIGRVVAEDHTGKHLTSESHHSNFGASELESSEAIPIRNTDAELLLEIVGINNVTESPLRVLTGGILLETADVVLSLLEAALSDVLPWRLRRKPDGGD